MIEHPGDDPKPNVVAVLEILKAMAAPYFVTPPAGLMSELSRFSFDKIQTKLAQGIASQAMAPRKNALMGSNICDDISCSFNTA
jgi:hypothetical protein